MSGKKIIPSYNLYKTLNASSRFEFFKLEEAYNPYNAKAAHRHNYYEILYFKDSGGVHELDFSSYPIRANTLHFISPEQVHLLRRNKNVTGYVLSFEKEFCYNEAGGVSHMNNFPFFNDPYSPPIVRLKTKANQKEVLDIIAKIQLEYYADNEDRISLLSAYLTTLLIKAKRWYVPEDISGSAMPVRSELTTKFKLLIEKNYLQIKSVSGYAEQLNITPGHLNDTIQKDTGRTASEMIHERIILEAKRLLYHSEKSVKEIAYSLNYDDPSHFVKFFKTQVTITPEQFRKQAREKYH